MRRDDHEDSLLGTWWVPTEPHRTFIGTLDIGQRLELQLHEETAAARLGRQPRLGYSILHGRTQDSCVTLLDNAEVATSASRSGERQQVHRRIASGTALVGASFLESMEDCRFNRASLRISNLDEWVSRTPFRPGDSETDSIEAVELPVLHASIPGGDVYLGRRTTTRWSRLTAAGYTSHEVIELSLDEDHPLDELEYRFIRPLEQLLALATGARCRALELRVGNGDAADPERTKWGMESFAVRRGRLDTVESGRPTIRPHMRFGMNSPSYSPNVEFGDVVARWFVLQESLASVCDLVFSLRAEAAGYLQQQMCTIASSIEGLHRALNPQLEEKTMEDRARNKAILALTKEKLPDHHEWLANQIRYAHRRPFLFRVRELLRDTGHLMATVVGDEEAWARQLRDIRDGIGHVLPSQDNRSFRQVVAMLRSAQLLAELVLLRQLGFTALECERAIDHHWERENVRTHMTESFPDWFTDSASAPPSRS